MAHATQLALVHAHSLHKPRPSGLRHHSTHPPRHSAVCLYTCVIVAFFGPLNCRFCSAQKRRRCSTTPDKGGPSNNGRRCHGTTAVHAGDDPYLWAPLGWKIECGAASLEAARAAEEAALALAGKLNAERPGAFVKVKRNGRQPSLLLQKGQGRWSWLEGQGAAVNTLSSQPAPSASLLSVGLGWPDSLSSRMRCFSSAKRLHCVLWLLAGPLRG